LPRVEHLDDVGVLHPPRRVRLVHEAAHVVGGDLILRVHHLDGHATMGGLVFGLVDDAHAPAAEHPAKPVPIGDGGAELVVIRRRDCHWPFDPA
jgi:hypothetical protein